MIINKKAVEYAMIYLRVSNGRLIQQGTMRCYLCPDRDNNKARLHKAHAILR